LGTKPPIPWRRYCAYTEGSKQKDNNLVKTLLDPDTAVHLQSEATRDLS